MHFLVRTTAAILVLTAGTVAARATLLRPRPSGLVIITLDTTRADRLPAYGFGGVATPAIDSLVSRGVVFDDAVTVAPLTLPAHTSLFTGLYPAAHGVRENGGRALEPSHATLAGILHDGGFHTAAFVGSVVLAGDRGLSRGFDVYDDGSADGTPAPKRRQGSEVVRRARAWIDGLDGKPFFLWVHLYDVHAPQALSIDLRRTYGDRYEGGIAYVDAQIGLLLDALARRHLLTNTVVILAGDHGESLGEHGEKEHGVFLYQSTLHVPLVVCAPGVAARRVAGATSLVDVFPTAVQLLGVRVRRMPLDGVSLLPALTHGRVPEHAVYAESQYAEHFGWGALRMVRDGRFKYIEAPTPELYDLERDPAEQQNLAHQHLATASALSRTLQTMNMPGSQQSGAATPLPSDRLEALKALGYVAR
jgi:arylsulfatase A-like enzyme